MLSRESCNNVMFAALCKALSSAIALAEKRLERMPIDHPELQDCVTKGLIKVYESVLAVAIKNPVVESRAMQSGLVGKYEELNALWYPTWDNNKGFIDFCHTLAKETAAGLTEAERADLDQTTINILCSPHLAAFDEGIREAAAQGAGV